MKLVFLFFIFFQSFFAYSQFFSAEIDWFGNESFFNDSIIEKHNIAAIHIWDSEKKDGNHFQDEKAFLHYEFNRNGKLTASYKSIVLSSKIDTALFQFFYNQQGQLYKRSEKQGLFHFNFFYFYREGQLAREVKINVANESYDTAFVHYFEHQKKAKTNRLIIQNSIRKPFMYLESECNEAAQLIRCKKGYIRNQNFSETDYLYESNRIKEVKINPMGESSNKRIAYSYKDDELHLVEHFDGLDLQKKYAFTYNQEGLPKAIIERDLIRKRIKIYRLEYLFYED